MSEPRVYLFWDNSNIFISAQHVAARRESQTPTNDIRIDFTNLFRLAVAGRTVGTAVAVGSIPPEQREIWDRMKRDTGIETQLFERGRISGTEQGLDQVLQTHMLRAGLDNQDNPQIAVLLTGDGAGFYDGIGFHADMERLHKNGWGVEVLAWDISCKRELREWVTRIGAYVKLEDYYDSVTHVKGGRLAKNLNLTRRPRAMVGESVIALKYKGEAEKSRTELEALRNKMAEKEHKKKKYQLKQERRETLKKRKSRKKRKH